MSNSTDTTPSLSSTTNPSTTQDSTTPTTEPTTTPSSSTTSVPPSTTTLPPSTTEITSIPPSSTTTVPPSTTPSISSSSTSSSVSTSISTSISISTPTDPTQPPSTSIVIETITSPQQRSSSTQATSSHSTSSAAPSALSAGGSSSGSSSGLGTGGTIAIAVVIPIVAIAALLFFGFWFWRKRKARKNAEEMRKNEMAEYGFNPNNDPTLAPAGASYAEDQSEMTEDNSGYRGWGATTSNRNPSTTLGSKAPGMSDTTGSQPGGYHPSPNAYSDAYSTDPVLGQGHPEGHDGVGALGGAAVGAAAAGALGRNRSQQNGHGVRRGPSNASSAYSNAAPSEASSEAPSMPRPYYEQEVPYNDYGQQAGHGPYDDGAYGGNGEPMVRDVQARRNTRIERAPTYPSGQGGISQNF